MKKTESAARNEDAARAAEKHPEILAREKRREEREAREREQAAKALHPDDPEEAARVAEQARLAAEKRRRDRDAVVKLCAEAHKSTDAARVVVEKRKQQAHQLEAALVDIEGLLVTARETSRSDPERGMAQVERAARMFDTFVKPFADEVLAELEQRVLAEDAAAAAANSKKEEAPAPAVNPANPQS